MRKLVLFCSNTGLGNLKYSTQLLKHVEEPSPFTWNVVIRGYAHSCNPWEAVVLYHRMLQKVVLPDKFTFPFVLKACSNFVALREGEQIHCQILKSPHQMDMFVQGSLIHMYAKCGFVEAAYTAFNLMHFKNTVSWNTMIDAYIKNGNIHAACQLFEKMPQRDIVSWNTMIDGYTKFGRIEISQKLFDEMPLRDAFSWNCMISGYVKHGKLNAAKELFDCMPSRDVVTWTTMVNGYAKCGEINFAHQVFEKMPFKSLVTWNTMIDGYAKYGDIKAAVKLFDTMPERNLTSWNIMLDAYAKHGELQTAHELFKQMCLRDIFSWNIMIDGYVRDGNIEAARELFRKMPYRDVVSWNSLIAGYRQKGQCKKAVELFHYMQTKQVEPDCATLAIVLPAIAELGLYVQGRWVHAYVDRRKISLNGAIGVAIIDMYSKCGFVDIALRTFDGITEKNIDHWNSMISGLAIHGYGYQAISLFESMRQLRVNPDDITFIGVLSACSHAGLVPEGHHYFRLMSSYYGIPPKVQHYGCMVDLLSRAGHLEEAWALVKSMPTKANVVIWRALLGASRKHGNIEIGEYAAKNLIHLEPHDTSSYVLLYNIYVNSGQQDSAFEIRRLMRENIVIKDPGFSSIELNGKIHEFTAGNILHPQILELHLFLTEMTQSLVSAG